MSAVRTLSCAALGVLALAACSKPSTKASGSASSAAGVAAPATAEKDSMGPEIPASQMPVIKAGLWETTETSAGRKPRQDRSCESGKRQPMSMGKECAKLTLRRTLLGKYVIDSECGYGDTHLAMHVEAKGDFQTHWSADFTSRLTLPGKAEEVDTSHKEARYVGACPAGMEADG